MGSFFKMSTGEASPSPKPFGKMSRGFGLSTGSDKKLSFTERLFARNVVKLYPNKYRFAIKRIEKVNGLTIALLNYPDCTSYGGDKVVVTTGDIGESFDPHFLEGNGIIARFTGDDSGWDNAITFARGYGVRNIS